LMKELLVTDYYASDYFVFRPQTFHQPPYRNHGAPLRNDVNQSSVYE
jgi:hypothetical protein